MNNSRNRYYVKNTESGTFTDITTMFNGLAVLKMDGFLEMGKPVNIFTQQWVDSQEEDFMITSRDVNDNPVVIRENVNIEITFIVRKSYYTPTGANDTGSTFNVQTVHDSFISYMTGSDVWVKSSYAGNKYVHCVCLEAYKPTTVELQRGDSSWIMGTLKLHCLNSAS